MAVTGGWSGGRWLVLGLIALIGVFYLATIREGHRWGDDFSLYILHAKNIAEGRPFHETGFIGGVGAPSYPPLIPLLLAPAYKFLGLNLWAMKAEFIVLFIAGLWLIFFLFERQLPLPYLLLLVGMIGLNHYFWNFKDNILSDFPFLGLLYLAFYLLQEIHRKEFSAAQRRAHLRSSILIGLVLCLCYATRSVGVLVLPCMVIHDLIRFRRVTGVTLIAALMVLLAFVLANLVLRSEIQFPLWFAVEPQVVLHKLRAFPYSLIVLWDNGRSKTIQQVLFVIFNVLAIIGYVRKVRTRLDVQDVFAVIYPLALLFLQARASIRYLIPVIPLYFFYGMLSLEALASSRARWRRLAFGGLALTMALTCIAKYSTSNLGSLPESVTGPEATALFAWARASTRENDIFVFRKPRALMLFAERRAACPRSNSPRHFVGFAKRMGARYVIVNRERSGQKRLRAFLARRPESFVRVYANDKFEVYRILAYDAGG